MPPKRALRRNITGPAPSIVPGANIIRTPDLAAMLAERKPVITNTQMHSWGRSLAGAIGLQRLRDLPALSMTKCRIGSVRR